MLQLTSAAFPTGAFSHSLGLETFVQDGRVHDAATFGQWLDVHLRHAAGPTDGAGVALVHRAVTAGAWDTVRRVDGLLEALKLAPEPRAASLAMGQATLRVAREVFPGPAAVRCAELLAARAIRGHAAVVFGSVTADLGLTPPLATLAYLWSLASNLTAVATRLVPLGATAAQRALAGLAATVAAATDDAVVRQEADLGASALSQDIAAFRHTRLYSRLCMS